VLNSQYKDFEVIVVDNASSDKSLSLLKKRYSNEKKVRIIPLKEQFYFTGGSNIGAKHAKGSKLVFLNSDTEVNPSWLNELLATGKKHRNSLIQPKILKFNNKKIIDNVGGRYLFPGIGIGKGRGEKDFSGYDTDIKVDYVNGTVFMIEKKIFETLNGLDNWYCFQYEDVDLSLRARKKGYNLYYCHKAVVYHKGSLTFKATTPKAKLLFHIKKNRIQTILKNFTGCERVLRLSILLVLDKFWVLKEFYSGRFSSILILKQALWANINRSIKAFIEHRRVDELTKYLGKTNNASLLDLGCGDGLFIDIISNNGIKSVGVDLKQSSHPRVVTCSVEEFETKVKFSVVTMFHVLEHLESPLPVLKKIGGFLEKDGILVIEVPLTGNFTEKFLGKNYFAYHDKTHKQFFNQGDVYKLITDAGFEIITQKNNIYAFPFTIISSSFGMGPIWIILAILIFAPLKILSFMGMNNEIVRIYCKRK
jgi:GT2 family glycosyltransferase